MSFWIFYKAREYLGDSIYDKSTKAHGYQILLNLKLHFVVYQDSVNKYSVSPLKILLVDI